MANGIRTKFGPNLQRPIHLGHLRIALLTQAFTFVTGGEYILRIEDTDQNQYYQSRESLSNLLQDLAWAGVRWDEGPDRGGPYEPYIQSQRKQIYQQHVQSLLSSGHCYYCTCSRERLKQIRKEQAASRSPFRGYDGFCRDRGLTYKQAIAEIEQEPVVRFRVLKDRSVVSFVDFVSARVVSFSIALIEDFILVKSNGFPTYYLANVVDDHIMHISHMLRGVDGLASAPRQLLVYSAFGWEPPQFGFFSLLHADTSKRALSLPTVREFLNLGFAPEILSTYLLSINTPLKKPAENIEDMLEMCGNLILMHKLSRAKASFSRRRLDAFEQIL